MGNVRYRLPIPEHIRSYFEAARCAILRSTPRVEIAPWSSRMVRSHLIDLMNGRHLTVAGLARLAGVNRSAVAALANDRATRVELAVLERICRVLGCELGDLLEIVPDPVLPAKSVAGDH
jgi:putative transcriptional regulator